MKKILTLAALALVALASCTKNEIVVPEMDQEITFQTVINPATKALGAGEVAFDTGKKFYSYAYLLTGGEKTWAADKASSQLYFGPEGITYQTSKWKGEKSFYWPKDKNSNLTFFAWTDNTATPVAGIADCSAANGITFANVDITNASYKNKDLMVADIQEDKKSNTDPAEYNVAGVPTLFRHKLSSFVFTAKTKEAYANAEIKLVSIKFVNEVATKAEYTQTADNWTLLPVGTPTKGTTSMFDPATDLLLTSTKATLTPAADDFSILIPQTVPTGATSFEIVYTIKTEYVTGHPVTETVTETKALNAVYGETNWEKGKKYILDITIGLDEINWDPAVVDWVEDTASYNTPAA